MYSIHSKKRYTLIKWQEYVKFILVSIHLRWKRDFYLAKFFKYIQIYYLILQSNATLTENDPTVFYLWRCIPFFSPGQDRDISVNLNQTTARPGKSCDLLYHPYTGKTRYIYSNPGAGKIRLNGDILVWDGLVPLK